MIVKKVSVLKVRMKSCFHRRHGRGQSRRRRSPTRAWPGSISIRWGLSAHVGHGERGRPARRLRDDIFDENGEVVRSALAAKAFATPAATRKLEYHHDAPHRGASPTSSTASRLRASRPWWWNTRCSATARARWPTAPTWSWRCSRRWRPASSVPWPPGSQRGGRARPHRRQITDADRIEASDVVFNNDGTPTSCTQRGHLLVERV